MRMGFGYNSQIDYFFCFVNFDILKLTHFGARVIVVVSFFMACVIVVVSFLFFNLYI